MTYFSQKNKKTSSYSAMGIILSLNFWGKGVCESHLPYDKKNHENSDFLKVKTRKQDS